MIKRLFYIIVQRAFVLFNKTRPCFGKVYMFHKIGNNKDVYSIDKDNFIDFINKSKTNNFVDDKTFFLNANCDNVLITFDDAYEDVYNNAYPLLKKMHIPYIVFICNEFLNKKGYLNEEMISEMLNDSRCILGCHGLTHELSRPLTNDVLKNNLLKSKKILEDKFNYDIENYAFPYGSMYAVSNENISVAKSLFNNVYVTYPLAYNPKYDNAIPRININNSSYKKEIK